MNPGGTVIEHALTLDYRLAPGWLGPYVAALEEGRAMARRCAACARVSFPPERSCDCGEVEGSWIALPGTAVIARRAEGADGAFALARFDGADTAATVRLDGVAPDAARARLRPGHGPRLILHPVGEDAP